MANNTKTFFNRVRYTLLSSQFGSIAISDPVGWDSDYPTIVRSDEDQGITSVSSPNLKFYNDAFDYLKSAYDIGGIKADVRLLREERDDDTDQWRDSYEATLDFSTYQQSVEFIEMKLNESLFFKNIDSRKREAVELDRTTDLNGNPIDPLRYRLLELRGRDILRETKFENTQTITADQSGSEVVRFNDFAVPIQLKYKSDESFFAPSITIEDNVVDMDTAVVTRLSGDNAQYNGGTAYYITADTDKTIDIDFNIKGRVKWNAPGSDDARVQIIADVLNEDYTTVSKIDLYYQQTSLTELKRNEWQDFEINQAITYNLLGNQSLGLRVKAGVLETTSNSDQFLFEFERLEVTAIENQIGIVTACKVLTVFDVLYRLVLILTGKKTFVSDLLLNGNWASLLVTSGFLIRGFPDRTITISLDGILDSLRSIDDISMIINGNQMRVESKGFVFRKQVGLDLGKVNGITRAIMEDVHYSSVEIGSDFIGNYEEVVGLDEPNIRTQYTTSINIIDNPLKAVGKVRSDSYGISLAQQVPYESNPKKDTAYDKENFFIDAIFENGIYVVRKWQDDFESVPTGIYSPNTAFNLRLSPFNSVLRKRKTISIGLQKYPNERFIYANSEGNSNLVTVYPERADVLNEIFGASYFLPEIISFNKKININAFKSVVENPYFLVKFVNEFGDDEFGYINSLNLDSSGSFELLKAKW